MYCVPPADPLPTCRTHGNGAQPARLAASALPGDSALLRADMLLEHLMQRVRLEDIAASAQTLRQQLHTQLQNWLVTGGSGVVSYGLRFD